MKVISSVYPQRYAISVLQRKETGPVTKLLEADAIHLFSFKCLFLHASWKNPTGKHSGESQFSLSFLMPSLGGKTGRARVEMAQQI